MNEAQIISSCKAGERTGFHQLVSRYAPKLMGTCIRYVKDEEIAKDVLQESFIMIFSKIMDYQPTGSFEAWMNRIVVNNSLMNIRKRKKQLQIVEQEITDFKHLDDFDVENDLSEKEILDMLNELPDHYRIIFNLYVIEGYNHDEIGKMLDIQESTSRTKLVRARNKLKQIYNERSSMMYSKTNKIDLGKIKMIK